MQSCRTVFFQLLNLVPQGALEQAIARQGADVGVRRLPTKALFSALLFAQLTGRDSLRSLVEPFRRSLGPLCRSTLADALRGRSSGVFAEVQRAVHAKIVRDFPGHRTAPPRLVKDCVVLDASLIELCRNLNPWAEFRRGTSAVKLHQTFRLDTELPEISVITPGLRHDLPIARRHIRFTPGSTVIFDRGYWSARYLEELDRTGVAFVTRARRNNRFEVVEVLPVKEPSGVVSDERVQQIGSRGNRGCGVPLRRVVFFDEQSHREFTFLTNRFDLSATTIAALYKARWKVELFFKALKQNLKLKRFFGRSRNAVESQIRVALIAFLLVQLARKISKSLLSFSVASATLRTLALCHQPLSLILGHDPPNLATVAVYQVGGGTS